MLIDSRESKLRKLLCKISSPEVNKYPLEIKFKYIVCVRRKKNWDVYLSLQQNISIYFRGGKIENIDITQLEDVKRILIKALNVYFMYLLKKKRYFEITREYSRKMLSFLLFQVYRKNYLSQKCSIFYYTLLQIKSVFLFIQWFIINGLPALKI